MGVISPGGPAPWGTQLAMGLGRMATGLQMGHGGHSWGCLPEAAYSHSGEWPREGWAGSDSWGGHPLSVPVPEGARVPPSPPVLWVFGWSKPNILPHCHLTWIPDFLYFQRRP